MNPRCMYCGEDDSWCADTCRDEERELEMEEQFETYYLDRLLRYSLFRVIKDWFFMRYYQWKEKHFPREFNSDDIPF